MRWLNQFLLACAIAALPLISAAQCLPGEVEVIVEINPDSYPNETSWDLLSGTDTIAQGLANSDTICVPAGDCLMFTIHDSYGDGICCAYGTGSYTVYVDGVPEATGGTFGYSESSSINCPPGASCGTAIAANEGGYWAPSADTWYSFSPDSVGMYEISTCFSDSNLCDTRIWVYDYCTGLAWDSTNQATIYYDDTSGGCGNLAMVLAALDPAETYWIRIGTSGGSCTGAIYWELQYNGPVVGCTDPAACNYHPLSTVTDTCYYAPDSLCPGGPDLWLLESELVSSMYMDVTPVDPCYVDEGCLSGYGVREILRFTTWIKNIGDQDYYIGTPASYPDQFEWDACHGHWHYEGYAEYKVYDAAGNLMPLGYKNGFCVMDLECSGGGTAQYGCSNMGITAGCGDIYSASLDCQWIDVTDLPDGDYQMAATVNWDWDPDALGRYETNYLNNWAHVCFNIDRSGGFPDFSVYGSCTPHYDCDSIPYGQNMPDCAGDCNGGRLQGDLDQNAVQEILDAAHYVDSILALNISAALCTDLNIDGDITVYDATLIQQCANDPIECTFPGGIVNINHTVDLSILNVDLASGYLDVGILNPDNEVLAYEFNMSGIDITAVSNLINPSDYPITPDNNMVKVIGISYQDSLIPKDTVVEPLVRIWFTNPMDTICISEVVDIVNRDYEEVLHTISNGCVFMTGVEQFQHLDNIGMSIAPNPSNGIFNVTMLGELTGSATISVIDARGRVVREVSVMRGSNRVEVDLTGLEGGFYVFSMSSPHGVTNSRVVLTK